MTTWKDRPATARPWTAHHYPEGSVIQPEGSDRSIFAISNLTPCVSEADAELIVNAVNALPEPDDEAVHEWFELTYSNYLTLPRSLMQSMPGLWQSKMVALLDEMRAAFKHLEWPDYKVDAGKWCYLSDLNDSTLDALGITSQCAGEDVTERKHDPSECCPGECIYYDRDGDQIDHHTASVFVPGKDPMPHYNRGRTRVPRAGQLATEGQS